MTQILIKIIVSLGVIVAVTAIAKKLPSIAGLISVMPLTGAMILVWVYLENKDDPIIMQDFTKGALWGILPSVLFYLVAFFCFKKHLPLSVVLIASFGSWLGAAVIHQWMLK
ncbi:MAG: DUF3147 family protein [Desulfatirhabdiaceae bacterium]